MDLFKEIINSSLYEFLFGDGGIIAVILTVVTIVISIIAAKVSKSRAEPTGDPPSDDVSRPHIDKPTDGQIPFEEKHKPEAKFGSDEYYVDFYKSIIKKMKLGDEIEPYDK